MEELLFGIGISAVAGALATVSGAAEDTESDIGSQGDPNSQVQLAPQIFTVYIVKLYPVNPQHTDFGALLEQALLGL